MKVLKISDVTIPVRQRKERPPGFIQLLKKSILSKGLLHPIVLSLRQEQDKFEYSLVAGEGRLTAIKELHEDGLQFSHDREAVQTGLIPYVLVTELSLADLAEAELEENLIRANLPWPEECAAKALIFELRRQQNPNQTIIDTAREIAEISGKSVATERFQVQQAILVTEHKNDPVVLSAKSRDAAYKGLLDKFEKKLKRDLLERGAIIKTGHEIIKGDCREVMAKMKDASIDTIIADPPYGIDADKMKRTVKHYYSDSPDYAMDVCRAIFQEGFRLLKAQGLLFMFCDMKRYYALEAMAQRMAFATWVSPIIWVKEPTGHAPWGRAGFIKTYEVLLLCVKGQKPLAVPGGPDVFQFNRPSRAKRVHAAEKPVDLLSHLIKLTCIQGDTVLDPCCGSAPIIEAAEKARVKTICVEADDSYHAEACARLSELNELPGGSDEEKDSGNRLAALEQQLGAIS